MSRTLLIVFCLLLAGQARGQSTDAETFFELKVRPVLAEKCFSCHGGKKVSNGLKLDSRAALLKGGESGPAILPGNPDKSLLIQAVRYKHESLRMPPSKPLPPAVVADLADWVKQGAVWPESRSIARNDKSTHWAFEPVKPVAPPADPSGWSANPIDNFIMARLNKEKLRPVEQADRRTLLRRVYFDLIGLPPSPEEQDAFLNESAAEPQAALEKLIERLLASPHYGERWGRHWLDVVRYADTAGDNADYPVPEARLYRDYVIDSFNADKPFDRFVQEQLAGDILARKGPREQYAERVIATGFLALSRRYATAPYELWHLTMEDTIETTGRAFLGLTLRCARCHDHKFDPITKEDYYALYGIFASTQFPWAGGEEFLTKKFPREHFQSMLPPDVAAARIGAFQDHLKQLEAEIASTERNARLIELDRQINSKARLASTVPQPQAEVFQAELAALRKERDSVNAQVQNRLNQLRSQLVNERKKGLPADLPVAYAVEEGKPADTYVQIRGDVEQHGPIVKRGVPKSFAGSMPIAIPADSSGRLQLAEWLTRPDNPLTARVMVNRIWQHHFGRGLVPTPSNFGISGAAPTHPELLDWLAARFVARRWSIKDMHRLIITSKVYQLSSKREEEGSKIDPDNRLLWRHDRRRLDAEAIRDALLTVSDRIDLRRGGSHPFPPIERWAWTQHQPFKDVYPSNHRSVYLMTQRFQRHPYLALFDGPDTNISTGQRTSSTVPQQALYLMNNAFTSEQAEGFARRLLASGGDAAKRLDMAERLAWGRPATAEEQERARHYLEEYRKQLAQIGVPAERQELEAWTSVARILLCANEFVYLD